jgi:anaerobic selenocysteine-containing dehydrogenase
MVDWQIWAELAKRMGYAEYFPWKDDDDLFDTLLEDTKISADDLRRSPTGIIYASVEERRYQKKGFHTPSGKVEIYSERMERLGYDPLPTFHEPAESPVTNPSLAEKYPLILVSGTRTKAFTHSQHRNVPSLREHVPEALIEINTRTAKDLGVINGDMVVVESPRGSIRLRANVTDDIHPRVVSIQHGWNEANVNLLTDHMALDPISGFPGYKQVLCRVKKAPPLQASFLG